MENETTNKTQGEEVFVLCLKCRINTYQTVLFSVDFDGEDEYEAFQWDRHYQIIKCQGCKTISFREANSHSEDYFQTEDGFEPIVHECLYPPRFLGRKGIGHAVRIIPDKIRGIYNETLNALNSDLSVLAGIGIRALVETICKEKDAAGRNLTKKIDDLVEKRILTPIGAEALHKLRVLGNKSAHEVEPHSTKQLNIAMNVVEHLLRDVYIIPKQVQSAFDE